MIRVKDVLEIAKSFKYIRIEDCHCELLINQNRDMLNINSTSNDIIKSLPVENIYHENFKTIIIVTNIEAKNIPEYVLKNRKVENEENDI